MADANLNIDGGLGSSVRTVAVTTADSAADANLTQSASIIQAGTAATTSNLTADAGLSTVLGAPIRATSATLGADAHLDSLGVVPTAVTTSSLSVSASVGAVQGVLVRTTSSIGAKASFQAQSNKILTPRLPDASSPLVSPTEFLYLDVYKRESPTAKYDTLPRYLELSCQEEIGGPGGGSFKIHVDDPKLVADQGNLFAPYNVFKIRRGTANVGAFILQTRELTAVDNDENAARVWQVSGEGLLGWTRNAVVYPENGQTGQYTADNRAFNFSAINKSRWYDSSQWQRPGNVAKYKISNSPYSTKPADWPDAPNAYFVWAPGAPAFNTDNSTSQADAARDALDTLQTQLDATKALYANEKTSVATMQKSLTTLSTVLKAFSTAAGKAQNAAPGSGTPVRHAWDDAQDYAASVVSTVNSAAGSKTRKTWSSALSKVGSAITKGNYAASLTQPMPTQPQGDCYFRCEFVAAADGTYTFYFAGNNQLDAYIDGALVMSAAAAAENIDATQTVSQDLNAGNHVFAVKVTNQTSGISGFIGAVFKEGKDAEGDDAAIPAQLLSYTGDSKWTVCAYPSSPPGWTVGEILLRLLDEARDRGVYFPNWIRPTFTEDRDSGGNPWLRSDDYSFDVGTEYFDVITAIQDAGAEISIDPETYTFDVYGQRGTNRSGYNLTTSQQDPTQTNPVVLRVGYNLLAADNTVTGALKSTLLVRATDGYYNGSRSPDPALGVIEGSFQTNAKRSASTDVVNLALDKFSIPDTSSTYGVVPLSNVIPLTHFDVGDWVQAPGDDFVITPRRVMSVSIEADSDTGIAMYALEFDTIQQDRLTKLERRLDKLLNTGTSVGGVLSSTTSVNLPTTVSRGNGSSAPKTLNAPTNLQAESDAYFTTDGRPTSQVKLTWTPPLSSGGSIQQVSFYEVWGSQTTDPMVAIGKTANTTYVVLDLELDTDYQYKVRARSVDSPAYSDFSNIVTLTTAIPLNELDKPTAPVVTSKLGVVTVFWDGNLVGDDGVPHAPENRLANVRIQMDTTSAFSNPTFIGQSLSVAGSSTIPYLTVGSTYWFRMVAIDTFGLVSATSDATQCTVVGIDFTDMAPIVGQQVQNNATILYQPNTPSAAYQNSKTTWYKTDAGYKPFRWDATQMQWVGITYGLQDDGSGTAIYSFIQTGAIAANAVSTFQIQAGAVTADKIDVGAINAQHINLGSYIPTGFAVNRVPGTLLDASYWTSTGDAITRRNLNPERVTYTTGGVLMDASGSARSLWSATPVMPVPDSGRIIVDWIASSDATQLWVRNITPTNGYGWTQVYIDGTQAKRAFGHVVYDFPDATTQYAVYFVLDPYSGTSLLKAATVNEVSSTYTNMENVQITQSGVFLYNSKGDLTLSISPSQKNFFAFRNDDGALASTIALNQDGTGQFEAVTAKSITAIDQLGIDDNNYLAAPSTDGKAALVLNGTDLLGRIDDDDVNGGTFFDYNGVPYLDRFSRNVIYRGYWDLPDQSTYQYQVTAQYQRFASGSFTLQPGRQYMIVVNNGSLQFGDNTTALGRNLYFDLMLEVGGLGNVMLSGVRAMRDVVYYKGSNPSGSWNHPPITVAAQDGANLSAGALAQGIIPANVPIYWQYGSSLSAVPTNVIPVTSYGSGQSLTVIDQGPAFNLFFQPTYAADSSYTNRYSGGNGGGPSGSGNGSRNKTISKTKTLNGSWSRSFTNEGNAIITGSSEFSDSNSLYQGQLKGRGVGGMIGFPILNLPAGSTVTKVQLYLKNRHYDSSKGGALRLGGHGAASPTSTFQMNLAADYRFLYGEGKWVTLPGDWNKFFQNGSYRGISIGNISTNAIFDGVGKKQPPQLRISYTYTV